MFRKHYRSVRLQEKNTIIISADNVSSYPLTPTFKHTGLLRMATVMTTLSQSRSSWVYKKIQEKQAAVVQKKQSSGARGYEEQFLWPPLKTTKRNLLQWWHCDIVTRDCSLATQHSVVVPDAQFLINGWVTRERMVLITEEQVCECVHVCVWCVSPSQYRLPKSRGVSVCSLLPGLTISFYIFPSTS